jgi:hypothetical protein
VKPPAAGGVSAPHRPRHGGVRAAGGASPNSAGRPLGLPSRHQGLPSYRPGPGPAFRGNVSGRPGTRHPTGRYRESTEINLYREHQRVHTGRRNWHDGATPAALSRHTKWQNVCRHAQDGTEDHGGGPGPGGQRSARQEDRVRSGCQRHLNCWSWLGRRRTSSRKTTRRRGTTWAWRRTPRNGSRASSG